MVSDLRIPRCLYSVRDLFGDVPWGRLMHLLTLREPSFAMTRFIVSNALAARWIFNSCKAFRLRCLPHYC